MNERERRRRAAHYNRHNSEEEKQRGGGLKIFIQLVICMAIMASVIFCGSYELPIGQTLQGFTKESLSHNINLRPAFAALKGFVSENISTPALPDAGESAVFNEQTPQVSDISGGETN